MATMSVSLGTNAMPAVKVAIEHAQQHPDHDPFVIMTVAPESGYRSVSARCYECDTNEFGEFRQAVVLANDEGI